MTYFLCGRTCISLLFYPTIYLTVALCSRVKPNLSIRRISDSHYTSCKDMSANAAWWMSFSSLFFFNCIVVPGFRLPPSHLFISLMTSKLIYKTVIYIAKNGILIAGILSVLTVEGASSVSPGSDGRPAAMCLLDTTCHHPSVLMLSLYWSHSL